MHSYKATVEFNDPTGILYKIISADLEKSVKSDRSETKLKKGNNKAVVEITAKDFVAMRASLSSINKIVAVFEKINKLEKNEK